MDLSTATAPRRFPLERRLTTRHGTSAKRIIDLTAKPRLGLRGRGVPGWCTAVGLPFPETINRYEAYTGGRVARLGRTEILILPDRDAASLPPIGGTTGLYDAYREETWAWFRVECPKTTDALARLTSADLRPSRVAEGDVVQARVAGLDSVLIASDHAETRAFDLFLDIASAEFMADIFGDRCSEFEFYRAP